MGESVMSTAIKGEIYEKSLRGVTLCQAHIGWTVETCPERRRHGCAGDGDDDNCYSRRYVRTTEIEKAVNALLSKLPGANGNPNWTLKDAVAYAPAEVANWLIKTFGLAEGTAFAATNKTEGAAGARTQDLSE